MPPRESAVSVINIWSEQAGEQEPVQAPRPFEVDGVLRNEIDDVMLRVIARMEQTLGAEARRGGGTHDSKSGGASRSKSAMRRNARMDPMPWFFTWSY